VIEYPYLDNVHFKQRKLHLNTTQPDGVFITLFDNYNILEIDDLKNLDDEPITISNLYDHFTNMENNSEKLKDHETVLRKIEEKLFKDENQIVKKQLRNEEIEIVNTAARNILKNKELSNKIVKMFLKQNYENLFSENKIVSLMSGKMGYVTIRLIPMNSKPYEE